MLSREEKKKIFSKYMKEFRNGKMRSSSGHVVTSRDQALAIILSKIRQKEKTGSYGSA